MRRHVNEDYQPATLDRDVMVQEAMKVVGGQQVLDKDDAFDEEMYERAADDEYPE